LCIRDDRLAFMASVPLRGHGHVLVWDWRTGKQVAKIASLAISRSRQFTNNELLSQPCDHRFSTCSFLDRNSIIFPYLTSGKRRVLILQVVTFESPVITEEATLCYYHFELDVLGSLPQQPYFHNMNTLPSNPSKSYFPGFFHSEPSSRLLALDIETLTTDFILEGDIPLLILFIPHDVLLGYIMSHPSDTDTVVVPWETWGLGNAHIITLRDPPDRFPGSKMMCGMHAMTEPPMVICQGDQKMLRIMDCHPRRVHNTVTQDTHLRLGGAVDPHEGLGRSSRAERQEVCDEKIPYVFKDIPLPDGLRRENMKCVLGEDVVAVFEVDISFDSVMKMLTLFKYTSGEFGHRIEKVFYHPI
jgi:hypothetical protein